jgi:hypothetical protein
VSGIDAGSAGVFAERDVPDVMAAIWPSPNSDTGGEVVFRRSYGLLEGSEP